MAVAIQINTIVHSATRDRFPARAAIDGEDTDVEVNGLILELVSDNGANTFTVRVSRNVDELAAAINADTRIAATFTLLEN